jgi:hypothetical protein
VIVPNREQLAWAAGFFDGEGTIHLPRGSTRFQLAVSQTDLRRMRRFHAAVGMLGHLSNYASSRVSPNRC